MRALTDFGWMAHSILHGSGWGFALRVEAHFDESGTEQKEITLAGYLFEASRIDQFSSEWEALLKENNIPFLHMKDFASGNQPFDKIKDRTRLQMKFMKLIKSYSINGIVYNVTNAKENRGLSYLTGVKGALKTVLEWADRAAYHGKIAYFFEAGATGQGLADGEFREIALDPASAAAQRYAGHAFLPKQGNPGVQAADFLAWQYHNFTKKRSGRNLARLDMRALMRHPHLITDTCGETPREPATQSVEESRERIESVWYLPAVTEKYALEGAIIAPHFDETAIMYKGPSSVLACPKCWRAVSESPITSIANLTIKCWCGTYCHVREIMPPLSPLAYSGRF